MNRTCTFLSLAASVFFGIALPFPGANAADDEGFVHPVMRVPNIPAPQIDGKIGDDEWGPAAAFTGVTAEGWVRLYGEGDLFLGMGEVLDDGRVAPRRLLSTA